MARVGTSGIGVVRRIAVDDNGRAVGLGIWLQYVILRNKGAAAVRVYLTQADFDADNDNYIDVPVVAAEEPYGHWEGPLETAPGEQSDLWVKTASGSSTLEVVGFQRR